MAHVQITTDAGPARSSPRESQSGDDSWARTPPGGPQPADKQTAMDLDATAVSLISPPPKRSSRPSNGFAMDDLEAAETLAGFARQSSPPAKQPTPTSPFQVYTPPNAQPQAYSEPLLSLLTSQHPLIGSAINGSLSAYNVGKTYSSPFRYGAEFVERNIATPVASTVGTAGRITGVENGVRRWLTRGREQTDNDNAGNASPSASAMSTTSSTTSHKRRRDDNDHEMEGAQPPQRSRAASEISLTQGEYLPAYDANRSPTYSSRDPYPPDAPQHHNLGTSTWQTKLILSTSGLGVAMSGESRRSLKYCLRWLRWGNGRLGRLVYSLQALLAEYDAAGQRMRLQADQSASPQEQDSQPRDQAAIMAQLAALRVESERVLKKSLDVISNYTGGALPDNARTLVHRHITSLPTRFAFAWRGQQEALEEQQETLDSLSAMQVDVEAQSNENRVNPTPDGVPGASPGDSQQRRDAILAAKRMIVLAREGLEMMGQVSLVIDSTIVSAEEWCERLGRRIPEDEDSEIAAAVNGEAEAQHDVGTHEHVSEHQKTSKESPAVAEATENGA